MPRHQRRINPLNAKKGGGKRHSDFLDKLDKLVSVAELEEMTKEDWGIHLFAENSDQQMAREAMELLATQDPQILDLKKSQGSREFHLVFRG